MPITEDKIKELVAEDSYYRGKRSNRDILLQDIGYLVMPSASDITVETEEGEDKSKLRYDDTAIRANNKRASALKGILANPETQWFQLTLKNKDVDPTSSLNEWLQKASKKFIAILKDEKTKFYDNLDKILLDDGSYGISAGFVQESKKSYLNFKSFHYVDFTFAVNDEDDVDRIFRTFKLTLMQAVNKFGLGNLSKTLQDKYEDPKCRFQEIEFMHCVVPREERDRKNEDIIYNKRFAGYFIEKHQKHLVKEGGYDAMPYVVFKNRVRTGEIYPDSPAVNVIATIRQLNYLKWLLEVITENLAMPHRLVRSDAITGGEEISFNAGEASVVNVRAGQSLRDSVVSLDFSIDGRPAKELFNEYKMEVDDAFMVLEFEAMRKNNMSATEAVINNDRQLRNASPEIARLFSSLSELMALAFNIVVAIDERRYKNDQPLLLGEYPDELIKDGKIDLSELQFKFISPVARAMRDNELQALQGLMQSIGMLGQIDPNIVMRINADEALKYLIKIFEIPTQLTNDDETVEEMKQAKAEQQEQQQMMDQVQQGAEIAKTAGEAQQTMQGG